MSNFAEISCDNLILVLVSFKMFPSVLPKVTDCYLQLCDWNELQEWNKSVAELHHKFPSVQGLKSTVDHSYVKWGFIFVYNFIVYIVYLYFISHMLIPMMPPTRLWDPTSLWGPDGLQVKSDNGQLRDWRCLLFSGPKLILRQLNNWFFKKVSLWGVFFTFAIF